MADETEVSVRELRANLAEILHRASVLRETTYITSRGRRIAAIGPAALDSQDRELSPPP